jgi:uncharacterized protein
MRTSFQQGGLRLLAASLMAALVAIGSVVSSVGAANVAPSGLTYNQVMFTGSDGTVLYGTVVAPTTAGGDQPGVVLVGGSGPSKGVDNLAEADAFALGGVVSLVYDKRTVGYSDFERSFSMLAGDALAAVELLRGWPGVNPARVGIWSVSEGTWVASLAASRSTDVAFVVTVGASGVSPSRQSAWRSGELLRHVGVSGSLLPTYQYTATRLAVGSGIFAEANYDPVPAWEDTHQPVLALWGVYDQSSPPEESAAIIRQALQRGGNAHYTIRFFGDATHDLHVTNDQGFDSRDALAPGYTRLVTSWVNGLAHGLPAASAEPSPQESHESVALSRLAWYESPWAQLGAVLLFVIAFAGYPIVAGVRRAFGRRISRQVRRPAGMLAVAGLTAVLGGFVYLAFLVSTDAEHPGPVVVGRPLPWLLLQLVSVGVLVATVSTAVAWWRARHDVPAGVQAQIGLLLASGLVFVPWALYWGLLRP